MTWEVQFHKNFDPEFEALPDDVRNEYSLIPSCWNSLALRSAVPASIHLKVRVIQI